jgi:biotin carboxyl carrier protein
MVDAYRLGTLMAAPTVLRSGDREFRVEFDGDRVIVDGQPVEVPHRAHAVADGDKRWVFLDGDVFELEVVRAGRRRGGSHHGSLSAPMPATVIRVNTEAGARVKRGDTLVVLEAMKMELPVRATADGTVTAVKCRVGELVQPGTPLVEVDE